jgi:hypothetical protein
MPVVLELEAPDWTLSIWTRDIQKSQDQLKNTLAQRGKPLLPTVLKLNPALVIDAKCIEVLPAAASSDLEPRLPTAELTCAEPLFFENKSYDFTFAFNNSVASSPEPKIIHKLKRVEESFYASGDTLRGNINFGNDIGWFRLTLCYWKHGQVIVQNIAFEVHPTKMDLTSDIDVIQTKIDQQFPLWRFSLAKKTEHEFSASRKPHEYFPLLWLAHFEKLHVLFFNNAKLILNAPHSRLLPNTRHLTADKIKTKIGHKLEQKITNTLAMGNENKRFSVTTHLLSVDTPENQFVKMALSKCANTLSRFIASAKANDKKPDNQILSHSFYNTLNEWQSSLNSLLKRPFFNEVSDFKGFTRESLVLQQKTGYMGFYKIWQELKLYLDVLGSDASMSLKTVAELYEVWCFLEIRDALVELGFTEKHTKKPQLVQKDLEVKLIDGNRGAFYFEREDGITIRLAHEPEFSKTDMPHFEKIYSWTGKQRPDILLEATFDNDNKETIRWIFDAKYRIEQERDWDNVENPSDIDLVPIDAINQMHRYRDALIHIHQARDGEKEKTRPIFGAFVLYPAWVNESANKNPYQEAIEQISIGAFPLLPNHPNLWFKEFLTSALGAAPSAITANQPFVYTKANPDRFFIEEAARIPYTGMQTFRYSDLTLIASVEKEDERRPEYLERFRSGKARWYHTQFIATERQKITRNKMQEIKFCAVAVTNSNSDKVIEYIYPVIDLKLKSRNEIGIEVTGKEDLITQVKYWVFELGMPKKLARPIIKPTMEHFQLKLTKAEQVENGAEWNELVEVYDFSDN